MGSLQSLSNVLQKSIFLIISKKFCFVGCTKFPLTARKYKQILLGKTADSLLPLYPFTAFTKAASILLVLSWFLGYNFTSSAFVSFSMYGPFPPMGGMFSVSS